jgi:hypothetical protein
MQVGIGLVNWEWLAGLPDPAARVAALDRIAALKEPPEGRLVWGYDLACWHSNSATELMEVGESLASVADEVGGSVAELIRVVFPLVASSDLVGLDELGLRSIPGSYDFGSVSPAGVAAALVAAGQLDLGWLAAEIEPACPAHTERYLRQWLTVFSEAQARSMGIVADCR